jgi:hypothetical protein
MQARDYRVHGRQVSSIKHFAVATNRSFLFLQSQFAFIRKCSLLVDIVSRLSEKSIIFPCSVYLIVCAQAMHIKIKLNKMRNFNSIIFGVRRFFVWCINKNFHSLIFISHNPVLYTQFLRLSSK